MAQQGIFGTPESIQSTEAGNVFGSRFGTSAVNTNLFGGQSDHTSNSFESFSRQTGQSSANFGSFGERGGEATSTFGSVAELGARREGIVFGGATNLPVFGGQTIPQLSSGASSALFGRNFGFGANTPGQTTNFGANTAGHTANFGANTAGQTTNFGANTTGQTTIFGANTAGQTTNFGANTAGQTANFTTSTTSQVFGTSSSVPASNPFGTSQSSVLFSTNNQPLPSLFAGNTSSTVPPGAERSGFTQPVLSMTQTIESNVNATSFGQPSTSSSPFPMQSQNVIGTFPANTSGFISSGAASTGFRKRDSNGTFSGSTLFGKQQNTNVETSATVPVFTLKQNAPLATTASLFGGANAPQTGIFSTSTSSTRIPQPENKTMFSQKQLSDKPGVEPEKRENVHGKFHSEFSNVKGGEPVQTAESMFQMSHAVSNSQFSTQSSNIPAISASSGSGPLVASRDHTSSDILFGDSRNYVSAQAQEKSGTSTVFEKSMLFGKPVQKTEGLFGKPQASIPRRSLDNEFSSQDAFGKNQAESPQKSLSKWNRGKDVLQADRKRREVTSSTESFRDSKRTRPVEASPPAAVARSSSTRLSVDSLSPKNSIIVKDIPAHLNRGPVLRKHFSNFGTITRLQSLGLKRAANITFKTHEDALAAKNEGKYLVPGGPPLSIFWRANSKTKSPDSKQTQSREYLKESDRPKKKPVPGSVEDELASMAELPDFQEEFPAAPKQQDLAKSSPVRRRSPTPPPPPPAPQMLDVDVAKGLLKSIYKARAKDTTEKVAILDSRDKLLRLLRGRQQSDLATAKAFMGTCPDMCPEKERYYREDTRRLSVYEVIPSTMTSLTGLKSKVDHMCAVKEYSRSSADQDEPLPHELRPLGVLVATMSYLLSKIADLGEDGKWSEWYDFLWNRTRGIRKDITQQQLCDVQVAELLEKCARFHIFCSERLCEEDMMTFDSKINNENLTKCLQTLKELYADLEKRGVVCPNEAEFRGYMVLMNLNEGDILREIQQLRPEIRDSTHISFAVQVYNALNANNYVRFFRLVEEKASFLSACILHRYFNQIRSKALHIILKAHGASIKVALYPIEEIIRLLCFEDAKEVEGFCYHYCLSLRGVDVVLDAKAFTEPEGTLPQTRSQSLIEIKQENTSIGEVINGAPLPPLHLPYPSSSFDQDGVFIMTSDIQEALDSSKLFRPKVLPSVEEVKVQRERMMYSNEVVKSIARIVILDVVDTSIREIAEETARDEMSLSAVIMSEIEDILKTSVEESLRQVAHEVIQEQESDLRKKLEEELAARRHSACENLCDEIMKETVADMSKEMAKQEMSLVKAELHCQHIERCSQQLSDDLLLQVVDEVLEDVAVEVYDVDVVMKRERLEATEKLVEVIRCRKFIQVWRTKYLAQIRVKRAMLDFPSSPSVVPLREQLRRLVPVRPDTRISHKSFYIGERAKLSTASPMDVIQEQLYLTVHLSMASAHRMLSNLVMWRPLDMAHTVNTHLQRAFKNWTDAGIIEPETAVLQWKLVLSVPKTGPSSSLEESTFCKWVRAKLCKSADREELLRTVPPYDGEVLGTYQVGESGQKQSTMSTGICIRCFHGTWTDNEEISVKDKCLLKGTSAVMFILSPIENLQGWNKSSQCATWKKEKQRLHQILKQKPHSPAVPLVIIVPRVKSAGSISVKMLDENLELSDLYRQNLITAVHVAEPVLCNQDQLLQYVGDWTSQLTKCFRFAASNIPTPPNLRGKPVADYMEDIIVEFYKTSVYQDLRVRAKQQLLHQSPNTLLSLYNDVVDHAAMVSASGQLAGISWPAPEFDQCQPAGCPKSSWNTEAYMCDLYELVSKLRLPYFRYSDMEADDWSSVCHDVWLYVAAVTKKDSGFAKIYLHQQVADILSRSKKAFRQFCWLACNDGPSEPTYINMAWTDLIDACIHYKLVSLRTGQIALRRHEDEAEQPEDGQELEEVFVYYQETELDDWEPPQIWHDALRDTETAEPGLLKASIEKSAGTAKKDNSADSMETSTTYEGATEITPPSGTNQEVDNLTASQTDTTSSSSWADLKARLEAERAASEKYEKSLESCLSQSLQMESRAETRNESRNDITSLGPFLSPIKSDNSQGVRNRAGQFVSFSERKQDGRHEFDDSLRTPRRASFQRAVVTPRNTIFRTPITRSTERLSPAAAGEGDGDIFSLPPSLSERVSDLQHMVLSEKRAEFLFEMRLKTYLDPL